MLVNPLLVILGATASGKTKLAVKLASQLNGEVISADSRQVFKHMDIGTGKDLNEFTLNGMEINRHLINILEPGQQYNVDAFKNDFYDSFSAITKKNKLPILCGGTGMYIHSLFQNQTYTSIPADIQLRTMLSTLTKEELVAKLECYPQNHIKHVDVSSNKRLIRGVEIAEYLRFNTLEEVNKPNINYLTVGLKNEVENTRKNILIRLDQRLKNGLIEEVESLLAMGLSHEKLVFYGLEYKFLSNYLNGFLNYEELKSKLGIAICQFAKRQHTFFRKMEKDGVKIHWVDASKPTDALVDEVIQLSQIEDNYSF
ncbi:tRNA (adenosine(37)-N6)-dimethylallyltransferase MiaA [Pedobacter changchengzhani]|uniref:tRNA dimethylallyltransferase n=1 Tax=Pedobacter changchengzhani TaxID=2529274 RepID=A0A4R5ML85_9SPHI|nr:tRNA (adenosine(37)-N6)-dimethylallyltransferase MiaA [Pedobacter changchengzhani]TDG35849.1 tRNA (adenosine(37)-N6)-dimethylallyltransferase MiaA [Pedobacter changchengzhani]